MQAPAPHWYEHDCTIAPVQLLTTLFPEQMFVAVQVYVTTSESEAVPPAPVQVTVYVVVTVGETDAVPSVSSLVEKLVPVQEFALSDDHSRVDD